MPVGSLRGNLKQQRFIRKFVQRAGHTKSGSRDICWNYRLGGLQPRVLANRQPVRAPPCVFETTSNPRARGNDDSSPKNLAPRCLEPMPLLPRVERLSSIV